MATPGEHRFQDAIPFRPPARTEDQRKERDGREAYWRGMPRDESRPEPWLRGYDEAADKARPDNA